MQITFIGAAREVTGSCHVLKVGGRTVLLDCGMFQGARQESAAKNKALPVPIGEIDAVVLSHAHIDHAGRLPLLIREGYSKQIFATPATRDLCAIMLGDS
ncbi:MAG: MBL fold metallo-hydrolase, partial [Gemmatimonadaceae bacterium]